MNPRDSGGAGKNAVTSRERQSQGGRSTRLPRTGEPRALESDPETGLVVERILALLIDLVFAIGRHISAAVSGDEPQAPAALFGAAEKAGRIDAEPTTALAPPDGPHNVLVQLYLDTEPEEVTAVVSAALSGYREYVRQVADWITTHPSEGELLYCPCKLTGRWLKPRLPRPGWRWAGPPAHASGKRVRSRPKKTSAWSRARGAPRQ